MGGGSSETFVAVSVAVRAAAHPAGGVGGRLLGAVVRGGVEVSAGVVVEVLQEVEVEAGAQAWAGAGASAGAGEPAEAALDAAGLL